MTIQRVDSVASSGAASSLHEVALKSGILNQDPEQDDLLQTPSFEAGVFGVLFTLQEKDQQHNRWSHWTVLKYFVTAWQIYTTILTPEYGWDINPSSTLWRCLSVLTFRWFKDVGYHWYVATLYSFAGLLAANLALCVWVAWNFKEQKFGHVWPIKVVRYVAYVFIQVFDMTSLNFLQLGISCSYSAHGKAHLRMDLFPQHSCQRPPQIVNTVVSGLLLFVFMVVALLFNMAEVEVNPASQLPQALGHSGAEMTAFAIKALMTLVSVFLGWPKVAAVAYLLLAAWLAWEYLRWVPNLHTWVNCLKSGVAMSMLSTALLQVVLVFLPPRASRALTLAMAVSLGPAFLLGAAVAWVRIRLFTAAVTRAFRAADPEAIKPQDVYHFAHPRDVEVAARVARVWADLYTLDKGAVRRAEEIIKAGVALFPDSAFVALLYANFMLDMLGFSQTGAKQLESVRKLSPNLMCRFMLFVRHQQATQNAASSTIGKGGNMDLLGYVEYQRKQRTVMRHHKDALLAMANFWRILGSSSISFTSLSRSLENIDNSVSKAESAYRAAMELYNNSPRLVRLYGRFLETIKQDPWTAAQYYDQADMLEETKDYNGQGPSLPDGTPISRIDDVEKGILVTNAFGDIQVANRKLYDMFGYKKGELDGKNVTALMPPHEAKRHPAILRRYIDSGDKVAPYFRHPVLAVHRERVAFAVRIAISRASGLGEDSVFIGVLDPLPVESGAGRVWVTPEGIIVCCDSGFVTCFGYHPEDVIGMHLQKLLTTGPTKSADGAEAAAATNDVWATNQANHEKIELVQRMLASAADGADGDGDDPFGRTATKCLVLHKYDFAKPCSIGVRRDLTDSSILEVRMRLLSDEPQLLMVVERKGAIRHMSGDLAKVLGVRVGSGAGDEFATQAAGGEHQVMLELMVEAPPCCLDDFLPSPWKAMHYKYRKYVKGGSSMLSGAWGCRAAGDDGGSNSVGPTMRLVGMHGKPVYVHVAVMSKEEDGEPMHVVRMSRSSLETAIAERRLRMRVSLEGVVQELDEHDIASAAVSANELFGFPAEELVGCRVGDFLSHVAVPRRPATSGWKPPELDLLAEAEAMVAGLVEEDRGGGRGSGGVGPGSFFGSGGAGSSILQDDGLVWEPLDFAAFDFMVTQALQTPGISWRVNIVSPRVAAEAAALGPARAAAVLAKRTRQAVLKVDVKVPPPSARDTAPEKLIVHAELWTAEAITGVLEIGGTGRISGVLEEEVRPPGLLFGLPKADIVGSPLGALLRLLPGQSAAGLLSDSGVAKKGALKASSRKGKVAVKVGPVHYLEGFHRDHRPLSLAVQVVGKPGPGNPVIAVVRFANGRRPPASAAATARGGGGGATAASSGGPPHPRAAHVSLALGGQTISPHSIGDGGGGGIGGASFQPRIAAPAVAAPIPPDLLHVGGAMAAAQPVSGGGSNAVKLEAGAGPGSAVTTVLPPALSLAPVGMSRLAPGAAAMTGVSALAAGVRGLLKAKALSSSNGSGSSGGQLASGIEPMEEKDGNGASSPEKPESPPLAKPNRVYVKRPSAALPCRMPAEAPAVVDVAAAVAAVNAGLPPGTRSPSAGVCEPPAGKGKAGTGDGRAPGKAYGMAAAPSVAASQDLRLETLSLAAGEGGSEEGGDVAGLGGVNKWVVTEGKFFRNRVESLDGMSRAEGEPLDGEDDDDGATSFGGLSRATSSHFASPRGSMYGITTDYNDGGNRPPNGGHLHAQHHQQYNPYHNHRNHQQPYPHQQQYPHPYSYSYQYNNLQQHPQQHPHQQQQPYHHQQHPYQLNQRHNNPQNQQRANQNPYQQHPNQHPYQQHPNQHPYQQHHAHHRHGGLGMYGEVEERVGPAAGAVGGGNDWPQQQPHPHAHQILRRSSFLHSGSVVLEPGRGLDGMSVDPWDDSDGDSDDSGGSGGSSGSDTENEADYKRGKRYRKLIRLMNSPQARKAVDRLRLNTFLAVLAAMAIHVLSFSLIVTSIQKQTQALDQLADAGGGQRYLQRALVAVRALDQLYKGKGSPLTYGLGDAETFANDLLTYSDLYRGVSRGLLQQNGKNLETLFYSSMMEVWSGVNATTHADDVGSMTLWDALTRVFVSAKSVFQNHGEWHRQGLNISATLPGAFLLKSGQALSSGMRPVVDSLLRSVVSWTRTVNGLQLTFLLVEGLCVAGCCAAGLMYMLKKAFDQRYHLYETFLSIPTGLARVLAAQTTHLLDDESDSQSEDEDDGEREDEMTTAPQQSGGGVKRRALFDDSTITLMDQEQGGSGREARAGGGAGASGDDDAGGSSVMEPKGAADKAESAATEYDDGLPVGRSTVHAVYGRKSRAASKRFRPLEDESFGPLRDLSLLTPSAGPESVTMRRLGLGGSGGGGRWWREACCCLQPFLRRWRTGGAVQPTSVGGGADGGGEAAPQQPRRTLVRNSRVAKGMLFMVLLYSLLVIIFYSVNFVILQDLVEQMALQAVADQNTERAYRAVFYAQELVAEEDPAAVPARVGLLRAATTALRDAYYTLRMGSHAAAVLGNDVEQFPEVKSHGMVNGSAVMFDIFYADDTCMRLSEHWPCPSRAYRYYEVVRSGADGIMMQLLTELSMLADAATAAVTTVTTTTARSLLPLQQQQQQPLLPGHNASSWDFIYNVGTVDLNDANLRIAEQHIANVKHTLNVVVVLHAMLLLLLTGLFLLFLVLGYLPLLRRMDKEKRRIAEMMSQLPGELDVMRLFSIALLGPNAKSSHGHRHHSQTGLDGSGDGGGGGAAGGSSRLAGYIGGIHGAGGAVVAAPRSASPPPPAAGGSGSGGAAHAVEAAAAAGVKNGEAGIDDRARANDVVEVTGGSSKDYQTWKDILARTSHSGAAAGAGSEIATGGQQQRTKIRSSSQFGGP